MFVDYPCNIRSCRFFYLFCGQIQFVFLIIYTMYGNLHYICSTNVNTAVMTSLSIRVDETLKKNFDSLCDEFGLSSSAAVNIFMKTVVRERRIPFEIKAFAGESMVRAEGLAAFERLRKQAAESGASEMTPEDINREIEAARNGKRSNSSH